MRKASVMNKPSIYIIAMMLSAFISGTACADNIDDKHVKMVEDDVRAKVMPQVSAYEDKRLVSIQKALDSKNEEGAWEQFKSRKGQLLSLREAVVKGLEKNLTIAIGEQDREAAKHVVQEAKAAFDPIFTLGLSYSQNDTTTRYRTGKVIKKNFQPFAPKYYQDIPAGNNSPALTRMGYRSQTLQVGVEDVIEASTDPAYAPTRIYNFSMDLAQELPNGVQVKLSSVTSKQRIYYRDGYYWKNGQYSTDFTFSAYSPLPYAKGFGEYSPKSVYEKQMRISNDRAEWTLKSTVNSILRQISTAYWNVVLNVESLYSTEENFKLISEQRARVLRRFNLRRATEYEKAQIDAEYKKAMIDVEQARSAYLLASNTLGELIENSDVEMSSKIYMPFGYSDAVKEKAVLSYEDVMKTAKEYRPDYHIAKYSEKIDELSLRGSENQALPDASLTVTLANKQDGSVYGYKDLKQSWANAFDPDEHTQNYTLAFNRPWGNRVANAGVAKSFYSLQDRVLSNRDIDKGVKEEISVLMSELDNARVRINLAAKEKDRVLTAYNGLLRKQKVGGDVKQDEIILTSRRLLSANLSHISALVENKKAEMNILASQGTLANEIGEQTAVSDFDKERIAHLADAGHIKSFAPVDKKEAKKEEKKD